MKQHTTEERQRKLSSAKSLRHACGAERAEGCQSAHDENLTADDTAAFFGHDADCYDNQTVQTTEDFAAGHVQ